MFQQTLVNYETPKLVKGHPAKTKPMEPKMRCGAYTEESESSDEESVREPKLDLLDILIPPRWAKDGDRMLVQKASRSPATSRDVVKLQERLDYELMKGNVKEIGICPVRRQLYDQVFDELIRQEAIACPERSRLLKMVRKESEVSLYALDAAYTSSLVYGLQKSLTGASRTPELIQEMAELSMQVHKVEDDVVCMRKKAEEIKMMAQKQESELLATFETDEEQLSIISE